MAPINRETIELAPTARLAHAESESAHLNNYYFIHKWGFTTVRPGVERVR